MLQSEFVASKRPWLRCSKALVIAVFCAAWPINAPAQGPSPEVAPTLFPSGGLLSYSSGFVTRRPLSAANPQSVTARPTFSHSGRFTFAWGFRRDFQLTLVVPVNTDRFANPRAVLPFRVGGTGLGDTLVLLKYRFYRRDSERGTTQVSVTLGPKLPTGRTDLRDSIGVRLPAGLQPGAGSPGVFIEGDWTYTGLFHVKKLVADESLQFEWSSEGTGNLQLGNTLESRFWLSYRPYQTREVNRELFLGPTLTVTHAGEESLARARQRGSGGDALLLGVTSYAGLRPGLHVFISADFPAAQTANRLQMQTKYRVRFGITRQFQMHR